MARIYDPHSFFATIALTDWASLAKQENRRVDIQKLTAVVQLRWLVADVVGVPPLPFTVWRRRGETKLQDIREAGDFADDFGVAHVLAEPMVTLQVDVTPFSPNSPVTLAGFAEPPRPESLAAATARTASGPTTLQIRASGIEYFVVTGGSVTGLRGESVRDALAADWAEFEYVGLPVDVSWQDSRYSTDDQGLVVAKAPPADAARQRLERGLAPFGWRPTTAANCTVPDWEPPDPASYVAEAQATTLQQVRALFDPGVAPAKQVTLRPVTAVPGPTSGGRTAPGNSTTGVPLLGTLLVGPGNDSAAALGLGFGTAYPLSDNQQIPGAVVSGDLMVTATYPLGTADDGVDVEFAVVLPWPAVRHQPPAAPTGLTAERSGLLLPDTDVVPWREMVRLVFDRVQPSVALQRPTVGALVRYPSAPGPADLAVEKDADAGGFRSLLLVARPDPNSGQVALVDPEAGELPVDLSPRTIGHAVTVADVYGTWSSWADVDHDGAAPPYPIPQVVSARADAEYLGTSTCPATFAADVVVDWQSRTPGALELRAALCPVDYAGAPLPPGVTPFGVPTGCVLRTESLAVVGDEIVPASAGVDVQYLTADGAGFVDPSGPDFPDATRSATGDSRRYRLTLTGGVLDFGASAHYAVALWARELTTVPGAPWGDVAAQPVTTYVSSPVPPVVVFVAPPAVPLGSLPDATNSSHVTVSTAGVAGAASVTVWQVAESRLRVAAGLAPQADAGTPLPERYLALQQAYDALNGSAQRTPFTRFGTYPAGTNEVDVTLPRGSREIMLFSVTAVNAAGVESAWPTSHSGLQAAIAPELVAPSAPVLSATVDPGGATYSVTLAARCEVPIARFELYATHVPGAAADIATMGPPLRVDPAPAASDPQPLPPGPLVQLTVPGLPLTADWRPLRLRAVAVPQERDDAAARFGVRSPASPVALLSSPPTTPPDLSALTVHGWGGATGVRVSFTSALPLDVGTLAVTARTGATTLLAGGGPLAALPIGAAEPPAGADAGVVIRSAPSAGVTTYEAWFRRASEADAVDIEVVLRDARGRVSVRTASVAPGAIDPPSIVIVESWVAAPFLLARWTTDAPPDDGTGPSVLTVSGISRRIFPPLGPRRPGEPTVPPFPLPRRVAVSASFPMPEIRDASTGLQNVDVDVVRLPAGSAFVYVAAVRVPVPGSMTLSIRTPAGQTGSALVVF